MSRVEKSEADNITEENRPSFMRVQVQHCAAREKTVPFHISKASVTLQLTSKNPQNILLVDGDSVEYD